MEACLNAHAPYAIPGDGMHIAHVLTVAAWLMHCLFICHRLTDSNYAAVHLSYLNCRFIDGRVWPKEDELEVRLMLDLVRHVTGQSWHTRFVSIPIHSPTAV